MTPTATRLPGPRRQPALTVDLDGRTIEAYPGETVAAVLMIAGRRAFFQVDSPYPPSRLYCNMGSCMQCLVTVNGELRVRACQTFVESGMQIETAE